ncbi:response regulator [Rufibacter tibetensis]|uniref:Response regulatory domain-containing protein n=1 Tax=Rufibacter tibetensis TaxID=512763 RepID=A0A0P0D1Y7_9BACT|nr:response regulator [Rufibacter tibetensis]ALJ00903.1 hypothetical protein DC20_20315 [Rufibacter tibetensis]
MRKINTVLVVDDDDAALFIAKKVLGKMELAENIITAKNGLEGFQLIKNASTAPDSAETFPGLILIDLKMPVMNGFKLIEAMGGLSLPFKPVVVVLTSSQNTIDMEKARNLKTDGYLVKPIKQESIEQLLGELMV